MVTCKPPYLYHFQCLETIDESSGRKKLRPRIERVLTILHTDTIAMLDWNPNGRFVMTTDTHDNVRVIDVKTGDIVMTTTTRRYDCHARFVVTGVTRKRESC